MRDDRNLGAADQMTENRRHRPGIHAAQIARSPRLQRVLQVLSDGQEHSTRDINHRANVCVAGTVVSELRANGADISCRYAGRSPDGGHIYMYRLVSPPAGWGSEDR